MPHDPKHRYEMPMLMAGAEGAMPSVGEFVERASSDSTTVLTAVAARIASLTNSYTIDSLDSRSQVCHAVSSEGTSPMWNTLSHTSREKAVSLPFPWHSATMT